MRKTLPLFITLVVLLFAQSAFAQQQSPQELAENALQEMKKTDPQSAQLFESALMRGDLAGAKKIYQDFKKTNSAVNEDASPAPAPKPSRPSLFERTLSGHFPDMTSELTQFGYDLFNKTASTFTPSATMPVGPDYLIGPGDQFTLTLWGTTEGIYTVQVSKEGQVTLPKVGVISVSGIRFGELERTIKRHLSKYYTNFNLSVAMGGLKTINVYVVGSVASPGSYPVQSLTTVYGALMAAGGPTKQGTLRTIQVLRTGKVIKTIDLYEFLLKGDRSQDIRLQNEDTVFVPLIGRIAGVSGMVYRPAIYELKGQETIGDVIATAGGIMPIAFGGRLQLTRYADNEKKVILDLNLNNAMADPKKPSSELREKVRNMDVIAIQPMYDRVWDTVNLNGSVAQPGDFQWRPDLRVKEIIAQGGLLPVSDLRRAEIIRLTDDLADRQVIPVDLAALLKGDESQNIELKPQDQLRVYSMYRQTEKITVSGEVFRPGTYEIVNGERLSDLLRRIGGFTKEAYVYGTVFRRQNVRDSEVKNLRTLISRLQTEVLQTAAESQATAIDKEQQTAAQAELNLNQGLLNNLKTMQEQTEGRVAINITDDIDSWAGSRDDLLLQNGDVIIVPKRPQEVLILGEVYSPGAQIHQPDMTVKQYIQQRGGYTKFAEDDQIFVVQANGFAYGADSPKVRNINKEKLQPGDAIFVPQKVERHAAMRSTRDIVDILFKTAVALATITIIF